MYKGVVFHDGDKGVNAAEVLLGDGKTRIQSLGFKDGSAGICIVRDFYNGEPFGTFAPEDLPCAADAFENKIILRANNERSIRAIIERLEEAITML